MEVVMTRIRRNARIVCLGFVLNALCLGACAQTTVTTPGGTAGVVPKYSSGTQIVNSQISDANGVVSLNKLSAQTFNNVLYANRFPGIDIGDQVNHAYASCPSTGAATGCRIVIPPGVYTYSTPVNLTSPTSA